ncbi:hypothetical protein BS17DRAFT_790797 [Gyrodon lividus]|nr:hypothetical protein BS17DRAFT_790797 [Gyrodon lividus]
MMYPDVRRVGERHEVELYWGKKLVFSSDYANLNPIAFTDACFESNSLNIQEWLY